ncbi:hypothetical protein AVEN_177640-1 [Araneus ventricosus]|uniref:Uncharacterized protein n=1 Tax=Araneus ventricosus TaxID=182803 RepID=A0A4Y2KIH7_ARAVE|nr:hypothetical protein AVEN_177640-1 [Araneus ventricosus]
MYCSSSAIVFGILDCDDTRGLSSTPKEKITWRQSWRIERPIHVTLCMHLVVGGNDSIIQMFAEKIEHFSRSMWAGTVLHEPRAVPKVLQSILNGHKFMENVQIFCCCNRLASENLLNQSKIQQRHLLKNLELILKFGKNKLSGFLSKTRQTVHFYRLSFFFN